MEYDLKLNDKDLHVISTALAEMPYRVSAEVIHKLSAQLNKGSTKGAESES